MLNVYLPLTKLPHKTKMEPTALGTNLEGHDAGVGAVLVDLIHGSLQGHGLLREVLQVL